jgi:hypothetical protein
VAGGNGAHNGGTEETEENGEENGEEERRKCTFQASEVTKNL